jgi:hypothetical protein
MHDSWRGGMAEYRSIDAFDSIETKHCFLNHSPFSSNHVSKFKSQNENPSHHMSRAPEQILGKAVKEGARLLFPIKRP